MFIPLLSRCLAKPGLLGFEIGSSARPANCRIEGDEVGEPIALNNDVAAQQRLRLGGIAVQDRPDHRLSCSAKDVPSLPGKRSCRSRYGFRRRRKGPALLQKKVIVAAKINGVVEELVAIVVAVRVGRSDRASAGFVRLEEAVDPRRSHGEPQVSRPFLQARPSPRTSRRPLPPSALRRSFRAAVA